MHYPGSALEPLDIIVAREPEGQTPTIGERGWPTWPCTTGPAPYCTFKHQGFPSSPALLINRPALRGDDVCILQTSSQQSTRGEVMLIGRGSLNGNINPFCFMLSPLAFVLLVFSCSCSICISCILFLSFFLSFYLGFIIVIDTNITS